MKSKTVYKILELILLLVGIIFIINPKINIIGAVIGVQAMPPKLSYMIGIYLFILSLILFLAESLEERAHHEKNKDYFKKRATELIDDPRLDAWIAQWEVPGIKNELKEEGFKVVRGPELDISNHLKHIKIEKGHNRYNQDVRKHLLVTMDPYDSRLYKSALFKSKNYDPELRKELYSGSEEVIRWGRKRKETYQEVK